MKKVIEKIKKHRETSQRKKRDKIIKRAVERTVLEYGEALKKLGND